MKLPNNYEEAIKAAKEKNKNKEKLNKLKPISNKIVKAYDKLSDTNKAIIDSLFKDLHELVEELRDLT